MDIQRGDQVYYRGEIWTVLRVRYSRFNPAIIQLSRMTERREVAYAETTAAELRRVEQVR